MTKQGKTKAIKLHRAGWLIWHWKNKHRTIKIAPWLAMSYRTHIGKDWEAVWMRTLCPSLDRALNMIRDAMTREGMIKINVSLRDPDHVAATGDTVDDVDDLVSRYKLWRKIAHPQEVQAVELRAMGHNFYEIECKIRVRRGTGKGRAIVKRGLEIYDELYRIERKRVRK